MTDFEPKIVAFLCNWCSYRGADLAGTSRMKCAANVRAIRVMCSGRVEPAFILRAFELGADGVLVLGCHIGECHYDTGNHRAAKRLPVLHSLLRIISVDRRCDLHIRRVRDKRLFVHFYGRFPVAFAHIYKT